MFIHINICFSPASVQAHVACESIAAGHGEHITVASATCNQQVVLGVSLQCLRSGVGQCSMICTPFWQKLAVFAGADLGRPQRKMQCGEMQPIQLVSTSGLITLCLPLGILYVHMHV